MSTKIFVTGTRGIPNVMGGVETHCEELFPRLAQLGFDITVARRATYVDDGLTEWQGVKLVDIATPRKKSSRPLCTPGEPLTVPSAWVPTLCTFMPLAPRCSPPGHACEACKLCSLIMAPTTTATSGDSWPRRCSSWASVWDAHLPPM